MNLETLDWDQSILDSIGVPREVLPEIRSSSQVYGEATGEKISTSVTLGSIVAVLAVAIGASVLKERRSPQPLNEVT